jgi:phosphatidylglycerol---prolipoprotein diacylglyceryl transferase
VYPTLYHFLNETFGISIAPLQIVNTFGLFVAISIALAFITMQTEMKRKTGQGLFKMVSQTTVTGRPYPISDYVINGILAFVFGYKVLYLAFNAGADFAPQEHIFNADGSWLWGIVLTAIILGFRYRADKKQRTDPPVSVTKDVDASIHMGTIATIALISGFSGAKVFHILEDPANLSFDSIVSGLFSGGGWTFYGGLICGAAGVLIYCYKKGLNVLHILDSGAPAMMISYGVGRFGCHFSGDGDWGLANGMAKPFSWLPDWMWAYTYPHNVLGVGEFAPAGMVQLDGFKGDYSYELLVPVFPTPLYEALAGLLLFAIIWKVLRHKVKSPGNLFAWYMVLAGLERFLVEFIREHGSSLYRIGSTTFSQAQLISVLLMLFGALWLLWGGKTLGRKWAPVSE